MLPGQGDFYTLIHGHPNNVECPILERAGEFARAFTEGDSQVTLLASTRILYCFFEGVAGISAK